MIKRGFTQILLIFIPMNALAYVFIWSGDFVFDDSEAIVKNTDVYGDNWRDTFHHDFWGSPINSNESHKSYRPLTTLSFRLNFIISDGLNAMHFKLTNLLCHTFCCILVWLAMRIILEENHDGPRFRDKSYLTTLLFSFHPIHVEAVSGIVGRADILAAITFILAFLSYHKAVQSELNDSCTFMFLTVILAGMSMLFKENGITVLGLCVLYQYSNKYRRKDPNYNYWRGHFQAIFLVFGLLAFMSARWSKMGSSLPQFKEIDNPTAFSKNIFTQIATTNYIYFLNFLLLIWPEWLCYDWSMGCVPLIEHVTDYRIVFIVLMNLYGIHLVRTKIFKRKKSPRERQIGIALALIVIPFLPAANILFPVGFVIAERILYIPSIGFCLLVVLGLSNIRKKWKKWRKKGLLVYCLVLGTFAAKIRHRSLDWVEEYSLFTSGLTVCPMNAKIHYNVAKVADASQNYDWAVDEYKTAIRLYPKYYQAMNNLANLLKNEEKYEEAETYLRKAIMYKEDFPAAWMNLGILLAHTKRYQESKHAYRTALKYRWKYSDCYYNMGNLYLELNEKQSAIDYWGEAIRFFPIHNQAWTNLLALLDNTGKLDVALQLIPKAIALLPNSPSVNFAAANIFGKNNNFIDAEKHFLKAIELFGSKVQPIHYSNLGVLYHRWKKYGLAAKMYQKALQINPSFKSARLHLRSLKI